MVKVILDLGSRFSSLLKRKMKVSEVFSIFEYSGLDKNPTSKNAIQSQSMQSDLGSGSVCTHKLRDFFKFCEVYHAYITTVQRRPAFHSGYLAPASSSYDYCSVLSMFEVLVLSAHPLIFVWEK